MINELYLFFFPDARFIFVAIMLIVVAHPVFSMNQINKRHIICKYRIVG